MIQFPVFPELFPGRFGSGMGGKAVLPFSVDFSTLPDGAIPGFSGAAWAIATGKAVGTPTLDPTNIVVNGGFDADSDWTKGTGWTIPAGGVAVGTTATGLLRNVAPAKSTWYSGSLVVVRNSGTLNVYVDDNATNVKTITSSNTYSFAGCSLDAQGKVAVLGTGGGFTGTVDDVVLQKLVVASMIAYKDQNLTNAKIVKASWTTIANGLPAGVFGWWDKANPMQNCIVAYHNGAGAVFLDKFVGTTRTRLLAISSVYVSGAAVEIRRTGATTFQLWYNNAQIDADQTINDAAIINNGYFGLFSSGGGNQVANFSLNP